MIIYGVKSNVIHEIDIKGTVCKNCDQAEPQEITVLSKYFHIYWIPFFPISKEVVSECTNCCKTISQREFPNSLKQQYNLHKQSYKSPLWYWSGLGIVGLFLLYINFLSVTTEIDSRILLLKADMENLTTHPLASDSVSTSLKTYVKNLTNKEIDPASFEYLAKIESDRALIIVKIPTLAEVTKESRIQMVNLVELVAVLEPALDDKDLYIGIHGRYNFMVVKTPYTTENSRFVSNKALLEFYGHKQER